MSIEEDNALLASTWNTAWVVPAGDEDGPVPSRWEILGIPGASTEWFDSAEKAIASAAAFTREHLQTVQRLRDVLAFLETALSLYSAAVRESLDVGLKCIQKELTQKMKEMRP